jgi:hypothetical protein
MRPRLAFLVAVTGVAIINQRSLGAQEWHLTTEAGRIRSALDPAAATPSVSLGLRYADPTTAVRLSGGVPTRSNEALWGGVAASKQLVLRANALLAGIDVMANAFTLVERSPATLPVPRPPFDPRATPDADRNGHAFAGQALPMLGYDGVRIQARVRAGASRYASRIGGENRDRSVTLADAQITWFPAAMFAVSPTVQQYRARGEATATFLGASLITASSSGSLWATAGTWSADRIDDLQWAAGARLQLHPNVSLEGSARHNAFDPLYLQPSQTSWSVGISVLLGRARVVAPPVPSAYRDGKALIRLPVSSSKTTPSIAGDFNAWTPALMQRDGDHWTYTIALAPGVYHYSFVSSTGEWFVPAGVAGRRDDGMGGHVAVLVVR